ncbi:MAG: DUF4418 family protein [Ruminiclostridium sp.]|nr:DUF4418 family protein [Ruminiclostridium sp.]
MKKRIGEIILFVLSLLLTVGIKLIFPACGAHDDGSFMNCRWAEQAVFGAGAAITLISLIALVFGGRREAADALLAVIPLAGVTAFIPEILIPLCKMPMMQCHTAMRPSVIVICCLIAVTALANAIVILRKKERTK